MQLFFFDMQSTQAESMGLFPADGQGDQVHRWEWHDLCGTMDEAAENVSYAVWCISVSKSFVGFLVDSSETVQHGVG